MKKRTLAGLLALIIIALSLPLSVPSASAAKATASKDAVTYDEIISAAADIVRQNEGSYSSVNADDNGALSVGWLQWHANRALNLLKDIVAADTATAKKLLGDTLYNEIVTASSWSSRILTSDEAERISKLISTEAGMKAQDELASRDLSAYIDHAIGYGVTDPAALVYYADIENQCGSGGAKRVLAAAAELCGSFADIDLDTLHAAALADSIAGRYSTRRQKTYNNCLLLEWEIMDSSYEVWDILSARNVRREPDTNSTLVTTIAKGTSVVILEKAAFDGLTRGRTSMGWITLDESSCALNEKLTGGFVPAPIIFDTNGGFFQENAPATNTATKLNSGRLANDLVIYNGDYAYDRAQTNAYGYECSVDATGKVLTTPYYGTCKTAIPNGGMVISAHGTMGAWLYANVKAGYFVSFDALTMKLTVFENESAYIASEKATTYGQKLGLLPIPQKSGFALSYWEDTNGAAVTADTVCASHLCTTLKAVWKVMSGNSITYMTDGGVFKGTALAKVDGVNTSRGTNQLILYKDKATTGTNSYGYEVAVGADGIVASIHGYGTGNAQIPAGGFVLSGHGAMDKWLTQNVAVGMKVVYDGQDCTVTVYKNEEIYNAITKKVVAGQKIGTLPEVEKEHYRFIGWYTASGSAVTQNTVMGTEGLIIYAKWEVLPGNLTFDAGGGKLSALISSMAYVGVNVSRGSGKLCVYKDKATSGTNAYGTEALVGPDGVVDFVYPYGKGNNPIPQGSFIISGNGEAATWISTKVSAGNYIEFRNGSIYLWENYGAFRAGSSDTVVYKEKYPALPTPSLEGSVFLGWRDKNGNAVKEGDTVDLLGDVTLYASWEKLARVTFNADCGRLVSSAVSCNANGFNITRGSNQLIIYAGKASTGASIYGTEAVVSADGTVTSVRPYGEKNAPIPDGGFVLSGNGTMSTWIKNNLRAGSYVVLNGFRVTAYESRQAADAEDGTMYVKKGSALTSLPDAAQEGKALSGWQSDGTVYTKGSVITKDTVLFAKWSVVSASLIFALDGGTVQGPVASIAIDGTNISRPAGKLILYNNDYSSKNTVTNPYGSEVAVNADGYVISAPVYGTCKTVIPSGGFVLSAHGAKSTWLSANVKIGDYIHVDKSTGTVTVYKSHGDCVADMGKTIYCNRPYGPLPTPVKDGCEFAGWKDANGTIVTESTVVTSCDVPVLTAVWTKPVSVTFDTVGGSLESASATLTGTNISRGSNALVLYKDKAKTGTNAYGTEAIVDALGKVVTVYSYGQGNNPIPSGSFALSGNGAMSRWIQTSLKAGYYVSVEGSTVKVYKNKASLLARNGSCKYTEGAVIGELPIPQKPGYTFAGWYNGDTRITESTKVSANATYLAHWNAEGIKISFDAAGGTFGEVHKVTATGKNMTRGVNNIIIYDSSYGSATTGTNIHGTEVIVGADGKVCDIRYYGSGNSTIPAGGFVLSGNGTGSAWLKDHVSVGDLIVLDGLGIAVYESEMHYVAANGKEVVFGTPFGVLPIPTRNGYTFAGWYTPAGILTTSESILSEAGYPLVLTAKWK